MSETTDVDREHLEDVEDGCGCAEIWETMSEQREATTEGSAPSTRASGDERHREQREVADD